MTTSSNSNLRHFGLLALLFALDALFLAAYAPTLAISEGEARIFYFNEGWLGDTIRLATLIFGQNNLGLRLPFVSLHLVNLLLIYAVARDTVRKREDALLAALMFALLPGVNSVALLISSAGPVITLSLVFIWLHKRLPYAAAAFLVGAVFLDGALFLLALAFALYNLYRRQWALMALALAALSLALFLHGFDTRGRPRGYFMDIFGLYGAIFSPLMLMFFIYTLYWYPVRREGELPMLWFASAVPFLLSIALSLRQNLPMQDFGPYAVIAAPLMAAAFMNSWRIRLPGYRRLHGWLFGIVFASLVILAFLSLIHKPLYALFPDPRKHFAYEHHFVDELAARLKESGITHVRADSPGLALRLRFYGVYEGGSYVLTRTPPKTPARRLEFTAAGRVVAVYYLRALAAK